MRSPLFDGVHEVANEDVIKKMNYFIEKASWGMNLYTNGNKKESFTLAKNLRRELKAEDKNNAHDRIRRVYQNHELFLDYYKWAIHESLVSITGPMSYEKVHGFLYDIKSYMVYYTPRNLRK